MSKKPSLTALDQQRQQLALWQQYQAVMKQQNLTIPDPDALDRSNDSDVLALFANVLGQPNFKQKLQLRHAGANVDSFRIDDVLSSSLNGRDEYTTEDVNLAKAHFAQTAHRLRGLLCSITEPRIADKILSDSRINNAETIRVMERNWKSFISQLSTLYPAGATSEQLIEAALNIFKIGTPGAMSSSISSGFSVPSTPTPSAASATPMSSTFAAALGTTSTPPSAPPSTPPRSTASSGATLMYSTPLSAITNYSPLTPKAYSAAIHNRVNAVMRNTPGADKKVVLKTVESEFKAEQKRLKEAAKEAERVAKEAAKEAERVAKEAAKEEERKAKEAERVAKEEAKKLAKENKDAQNKLNKGNNIRITRSLTNTANILAGMNNLGLEEEPTDGAQDGDQPTAAVKTDGRGRFKTKSAVKKGKGEAAKKQPIRIIKVVRRKK